ncbi:MAG: NPCBM/NEW2 domain-containing protein [Bacteroidetes bacterium]|nr:NPCBM/NEW2 domain-containing protein [Bacteroidota bacterium]
MRKIIFTVLLTLVFYFPFINSQTIWLDKLDLSSMSSGWNTPQADKSIAGNPLTIAGQKFDRGVGTHSISTFLLNLNGKGKRFTAEVGLDDEATSQGSVEFYIIGDKKILWKSGVMRKNDSAKKVDIDISKIKKLGLLVTDAGDGLDYDHADWCNAKLEMTGNVNSTSLVASIKHKPYILTPNPSDKPRINSAKVFGVRPGHPFLYTIAATGKRPMTFDAEYLPVGLLLNKKTGIITGMINKEGNYEVKLIAKNSLGKAESKFKISVGNTICLTPPMGWNSWNCWAEAVDADKVKAAADAMVKTGLINHGWTYINIDDCWAIKPDSHVAMPKDSLTSGDQRDKDGMINANKKFPDMPALTKYVHDKGLKIGIYSSPGPLTCAGYTACYQHEQQDAERFAEWGFDYLKYDWCSYGNIAKDKTLETYQEPYKVMRSALDKVDRDIVYSLCQYGMGEVWKWGDSVGGNLWRTTGDINDSWSNMSGIGFNQAGHEKYSGPGHWNDPDMLVVGLVGWGPSLHPTRLTPDEQYTHISLWCLLDAPLLIGCDLSRIDKFTLSLLSNDEVLAVDQDPLGKQASRIFNESGKQIWSKDMFDGSKAVGLFYTGVDNKAKDPADYFNWNKIPTKEKITLTASELGITGKFKVRDLWRQRDLGTFKDKYTAEVPYHGVILIKVTPKNK